MENSEQIRNLRKEKNEKIKNSEIRKIFKIYENKENLRFRVIGKNAKIEKTSKIDKPGNTLIYKLNIDNFL